jgi:hypothetical protein
LGGKNQNYKKIKTKLRLFVVLLILSLFTSALSGLGSPNRQRPQNPFKNIKARSQKGPEVGNRIRQLRAASKGVAAALDAFEKRGHTPKIDEAISITGGIDRTGQLARAGQIGRKANHAQTLTGDGVEVIFITVVDLDNEWQGTAIANFFDANGALEEQYVANVVITRSEYNLSEWTARFELKYEADGIGYLNHRPGMFTNFALGTPILQQTAPLSLDPSQFASSDQMSAYYNLYPEQALYDSLQPGGDGGGEILPIMPARFAKPQWGRPGPVISPWAFYTITGWGATARSVGIGCTAVAGGCAVGSLLTGGPAAGPCLAGTCTAVVIGSALNNLRIVRR